MSEPKHVPRVGVGGPVGSGKTALIEQVVPILAEEGYRVGIISNDVVSKEDAERIRKNLSKEKKIVPDDLVVGLAVGGCPHTAVREDPSMNISIVEEMELRHPEIDLILIESGGDNITTTFSPALADYFIYIIDVAGGDKYPRKRGMGIENCDLLLINKTDLAPYVGADLSVMERDAKIIRGLKPHLFVNCKTGQGVREVVGHIKHDLLFYAPPNIPLKKGTKKS
jgi:urease accessory protein